MLSISIPKETNFVRIHQVSIYPMAVVDFEEQDTNSYTNTFRRKPTTVKNKSSDQKTSPIDNYLSNDVIPITIFRRRNTCNT